MTKLATAIGVDISIIIPTYNRLWCLPHAIASCRSDACSCEIIVIDDGSSDGTWEWLQQQPGIIALRQDNWGKDTAVNNGFAHAKGEFIRFLDSDDFLLPNSNSRQIQLARTVNADVVVAGLKSLNDDNKIEVDIPWIDNDDFIAQQLGETRSCHYSAFIFRRSFIENIPHRQEFGPCDDRMFVIEVAIKNPIVAIDRGLAFVLRDHKKDRLTNARNINWLVGTWQHVKVYKQAEKLLIASGQISPRRRKAIAQIMWYAARKIAFWSLLDAERLMEWVAELDPNLVPPVRGVLGLVHQKLGFSRAERLVRVARVLRASLARR